MPPPSDHPCLTLRLLEQLFFVKQLAPGEHIPAPILSRLQSRQSESEFVSITRTNEEISIVGTAVDGEDADWRCIKIAGPMAFGLVGILASLTSPLKEKGIPVFAVSTWNTDYILIPKDKANNAKNALQTDKWRFESDSILLPTFG